MLSSFDICHQINTFISVEILGKVRFSLEDIIADRDEWSIVKWLQSLTVKLEVVGSILA